MQAQPVEETFTRAYPKYLQLARGFERQMRAGVLRVGDRLPSVRQLQATHRISVATAIGCYAWLERQGYDTLDALVFLEYLEEMQDEYVAHRDRLERQVLCLVRPD